MIVSDFTFQGHNGGLGLVDQESGDIKGTLF